MLQSTVRIPARPRIMNLTRVGLVAEIHDQVAHLLGSPCAPRCALPYPRFSREELGGRFPGLMAYPILKGGWERACQLTRGRVQVLGTVPWGTRVTRRKLDCLNPNLQKTKAHVRRKDA